MAPTTTITTHSRHQDIDNDYQNQEADAEKYEKQKPYVQTQIVYANAIFIAIFHVLAVYTILIFPYVNEFGLFIYTLITAHLAGFGVTGGVHRYYTHRTFKATLPMQILLLATYAMAGHNKVHDWVRDHRVHHKFTETDADPHNSQRGFFFSHVGWLMMRKHPEVTRKGKLIDMSDITDDSLVTWFDKNFILIKLTLCFVLPAVLPPVLWRASWYYSAMAQVARYILVLNNTWLVNSAAHMYGNKPYDRTISPRENLAVSILAMGEGWHNYHHTFPWDYKASEFGKLNLTTIWLRFFEKIGFVYDAKSPSDDLVKKVMKKFGDGSRLKFAHVEMPQDDSSAEMVLAENL